MLRNHDMQLRRRPGLPDCPKCGKQMNCVAKKSEIKNEEFACVLGLMPKIVGVAHVEIAEVRG